MDLIQVEHIDCLDGPFSGYVTIANAAGKRRALFHTFPWRSLQWHVMIKSCIDIGEWSDLETGQTRVGFYHQVDYALVCVFQSLNHRE